MTGILLAGGSGKRLDPLSRTVNKHLLPVGMEPMLFRPLKKLAEVCSDIMVITGTEHAGGIFSLLRSGQEFGVRLTYKVQENVGGIAQALALARDFVGYEPFCVVLGDNIFQDSLLPYANTFAKYLRESFGSTTHLSPAGMVLLKKVVDPSRFGVPRFLDKKLVEIIEKPKDPPTEYAVTGIYFYVGEGIFDLIADLKPSKRGELEISSLNTKLIKMGRMHFAVMDGWWSDAGTPESLWLANKLVRGEV